MHAWKIAELVIYRRCSLSYNVHFL